MNIRKGGDAADNLVEYYIKDRISEGIDVLFGLRKDGFDVDKYIVELLACGSNDICKKYFEYVKSIEQQVVTLKTEITNMKSSIEEWEVAPNGPKYNEAKDHFETICATMINNC
jgi:hypothetical protein